MSLRAHVTIDDIDLPAAWVTVEPYEITDGMMSYRADVFAADPNGRHPEPAVYGEDRHCAYSNWPDIYTQAAEDVAGAAWFAEPDL